MSNFDIVKSILNNQEEIAVEAVKSIYANQYNLIKHYKDLQKSKSVRDTKYHLQYLAEALAADSKSLFLDYIAWVTVIMENIGIDNENFIKNLQYTHEAIIKVSGIKENAELNDFLASAQALISNSYKRPGTFLLEENPHSDLAAQYLQSLLRTDRRYASELVMKAYESGISVKDIYKNIFQPVQWEIGRLWQINEISVAQEHFCTAATQLIMSQLYPYIFSSSKNGRKFVATSVGDELHEIGVRMVADFFEMEGWDTYYLGANTPRETILQTIKEIKPDILGLSTTITFHLNRVKEIISDVKENDISAKTRILVGGYPFNASRDLWNKIGADGYAPDAESALKVAEKLS